MIKNNKNKQRLLEYNTRPAKNPEEVFEYELSLIKNREIREATISLLKKVPNYFWYMPPSMTGKYHVRQYHCEGGLVMHTKAVARLCYFYATKVYANPAMCDELVAAALLHDGWKWGVREPFEYVKYKYHPENAANVIRKNKVIGNKNIARMVELHAGRFGNKDTGVPKKLSEWILHLADLLSTQIENLHEFDVK